MSQDTDTRTAGQALEGSDIDGRYTLLNKLGEGGMGVVFKAKQLSTNREVALKVVKLDTSDDGRIERFEQEIDIISQLSHPNIVRVIDTGTLPGHDVLYVVMELIDGISLGDLLWHKHAEGQYFKCRTRVEFALEVVYQLCAALTEPHRQGIIHRDIKPENILLAPSSDETVQLKVLDFGIARVLNTKSGRKKMTDSRVPFIGTPHYMAPEQVARSQYDARTDLYAVGVIFYELLSAVYPFDDDNLLALLLRKTQKNPPPLAESIQGDLPYPEVLELCEAMIARDIDKRPADAMQVRRTIEDIRDLYRFRRVRVPASEYLNRTPPSDAELAEMDEDERLEPLRSLYRKWLLYPSGRPILEDVEAARPRLTPLDPAPAIDPPSESFIPAEDSEPSFDELPFAETSALPTNPPQDDDEDIRDHTDVLSSPVKHKLKAWNVDVEWTNSINVDELDQDYGQMEEFFEEEDAGTEELDEAVTSIWKPDLSQIPQDILDSYGDSAALTSDTREDPSVQRSSPDPSVELEGVVPPGFSSSPGAPKHTPGLPKNTPGLDFGAVPELGGRSFDPNASGFGAQPVDPNASGFGAQPLAPNTSGFGAQPAAQTSQAPLSLSNEEMIADTIPEPISVDSPMIQQLLAEKEARARQAEDDFGDSTPSLMSLSGDEPDHHTVAKVALFDDEDATSGARQPQRTPTPSSAGRELPLDTPSEVEELELADIGPSRPSQVAREQAERTRANLEAAEREREQAASRKKLIPVIIVIAIAAILGALFAAGIL